MAELIRKYETQLRGRDGRRYEAQACGRQREDGTWEGWLEFPSLDGGEAVMSHRETTQPTREYLLYWATGLTDPYIDGALLRALTDAPIRFDIRSEPVSSMPPHPVPPTGRGSGAEAPHAILDPFHVYAEGDEILRGQLHALSASQLRNIALAYNLTDRDAARLENTSKPALITLIMAAVERTA